MIANVVNVVGASSKHCDIFFRKKFIIAEAHQNSEISSGRGLNQETTLKCLGDTWWDLYYVTLLSLITLFSHVIDLFEMIANDGIHSEQRLEANNLLELMLSFDFAFNLHLMKTLLGITSELLKALQKKGQDFLNAMNLVKICK